MTGPDSASAWLRHAPLIALAMALGAGLSAPARADQVFTVGSTLDQIDDDVSDGLCRTAAGTCTLRAALMQANRTSGVGATIIVPAGVYTLTRPRTPSGGELDGDLDLTTPTSGNPSIRIVGAGKSTTIIDANQIDRVLSIAANRSATISALTIRNGFSTGDGGGLDAALDSTVTLQDVAISGNTSLGYGGGIRSAGTLTMRDCVISGNASSTSGGGIHGNGVLSVDQTVFSDNTAGSAMGGAISQLHGTLVVRKSRLLSNHAVHGAGISQNNGYCHD